jgi:hypothetical protein
VQLGDFAVERCGEPRNPFLSHRKLALLPRLDAAQGCVSNTSAQWMFDLSVGHAQKAHSIAVRDAVMAEVDLLF